MLVVVSDLNFSRTLIGPREANTVLVVDSDAVLTGSITLELLKTIARWDSKILEILGLVELVQFASGNLPQPSRTDLAGLFGARAVEDVFGSLIGEGYNHV